MHGFPVAHRRFAGGTNGMRCTGGLKNCRMDIFLHQILDRSAGPMPAHGNLTIPDSV